MEIKIFVVKTEIEHNEKALTLLNAEKINLVNLFNGLTIIPNCLGYWINEKGIIETDKVEIWLIDVQKDLIEITAHEYTKTEVIFLKMPIARKFYQILSNIQKATYQKCQYHTLTP